MIAEPNWIDDLKSRQFHRDFEAALRAKDRARPTLRSRLRLALSQWLRRRADRLHPA